MPPPPSPTPQHVAAARYVCAVNYQCQHCICCCVFLLQNLINGALTIIMSYSLCLSLTHTHTGEAQTQHLLIPVPGVFTLMKDHPLSSHTDYHYLVAYHDYNHLYLRHTHKHDMNYNSLQIPSTLYISPPQS